ncbi:MAG: DUF4864 domain-containing protein [Pseudomonadota bacterium]
MRAMTKAMMRAGMRVRMLSVCVAVALVVFHSGLARADSDAVRKVISDQITAFQADDFDTAFTFASPSIKQIFGDAERFGQMVRNGYPMVWRPAEVTFLETEQVDGAFRQHVLIRDQQGVYYELQYDMIEGEEGWKINGVQVKRASEGIA